ncbi:MAG: CRISPR-associated protein, partial [Clostridia bacterium]|nr:CRISPR-associated protein [Clostridia bacterium]
MNLDWLAKFSDPYLKTKIGQGVFLGGIILGMVAKYQVKNGDKVDAAPIFKQIMFGKMQRRDLLQHLSRVPD